MIIQLQEKILTYTKEQLDQWRNGDKSLVPVFVEYRTTIVNQPKYHFGEIFVLRHYHETEGWLGFSSYALGMQYPNSINRAEGGAKVEELVPAIKLAQFRKLREQGQDARLGTGEPDLFLYNDSGAYMFVEVKKQTDRISQAQLRCIAQIIATLECPVEIVYLCEAGRQHAPRSYCLDLKTFAGWQERT